MNKNNEWMTADEMRFYRRLKINTFFHDFRPYQRVESLKQLKTFVRKSEVFQYGLELKRYYYYEYHQKTS